MGNDAIYVVVDNFFNMEHFIACTKATNATKVENLLFKEIARLHGLPRSIMS